MMSAIVEPMKRADNPPAFRSVATTAVHAGRWVLRGGSFNHAAADVRCAARSALHGDACDEYIGFRVAIDGEPPSASHPPDWVTIPAGPFRMT